MPRVSICCSVLNQSEWLREMIASVVAQTFTDWELVIVDDGSTEDIGAVVQSFADARIRLHRFDQNKGIPHGINWAFESATGEYVQPLAADEKIEPSKLELQVKFLDENLGIAAVWGLPQNGPMGARPEWEQYQLKAQNRNRAQWIATFVNLDDVPLGGCSALWRRTVFDTVGYFDTTLTMFVDHEWYLRVIENFEIRVLPYRWTSFRVDPDSISSYTDAKRGEVERQIAYVRAKHPIPAANTGTKVTIGIPVKDMAGFIQETLRSILAETHQDFEILVVDDGSSDGTAEAVRSFMQEHSEKRIHLHVFPENRGDREACNYMIEHATGDYFVPLSADDTIEPNFLEIGVRVLQANAQTEFVASQTDFMKEDGTPYAEPHPFKLIEKAANKSQEEWKARLWYGNVYFGAGLYRTQTLREIGGWRQKSGCLADYEMYQSLLQRGQIVVIEHALTHTRIHGKNMSTNFEPAWLRQTYADIKARFYRPRRKLIIATPFYSVSGFSPYIYALVHTVKALTQAGVEWEYWHPSGDAYVHRVKNTIFSKFMEDKEATDLLMIDSDMEWDVGALLKMLMLPEELIVGSYPQKNAWDKWTSRPKFQKNDDGKTWATQKELPDGGVLIEGEDLAGGFILVKRGILERYAAAHPDLRYIDESSDPTAPARVYTEFFSAGPINDGNATGVKRFWGEDRAFSRRLQAMGERWWIYADIMFGHWGMNGWSGNFNDHLKSMRSGVQVAAPDAVASQPLAMH